MARPMLRMRVPATAALLGGVSLPVLLSCGGGGAGPTTPATPAPAHAVTVVLFYDENGDGALQPQEAGRVPGVEVAVGGRTAVSEKLTGRAVVNGVAAGSHQVSVRAGTLPAYYQVAGQAATVSVPQAAGSETAVALTLPIGSNTPAVYMAFGDSITAGDGSTRHDGYRGLLEAALRQHFGAGTLVDESQSGQRADGGFERIGASLNRTRPAYTLILYGTNDWNRQECRDAPPCTVVDALRGMIGAARAAGSLPVLGTIPPVNPENAQEGRNEWVDRMNEFVRPMARQERAPLADIHSAFKRSGDLRLLFADRVHPNDRGYEIIAAEFLAAITAPLSASSAGMGWAPFAAPSRPRP